MNYNSIHVSIKFDKCFILTFVVKSTPLTMKKELILRSMLKLYILTKSASKALVFTMISSNASTPTLTFEPIKNLGSVICVSTRALR